MSSPRSSGPRHATESVDKCRSCGSRLRPGATWCSLCHTAVVEEPGPDRWAPLLPPAEPAATAISPMKAVPEPREADPGVEREAERLLAELAQDEARRDRQTRLAGLQQRFDAATGLTGTARQLVLTLTGGLVLLTGLILGLTLLGLLL